MAASVPPLGYATDLVYIISFYCTSVGGHVIHTRCRYLFGGRPEGVKIRFDVSV